MNDRTVLPGKEECPGYLQWSAFGARYPDTVCSSALDWSKAGYEPIATLCDADDDFRPKDVPCPFCDPDGFLDYEWGGAWTVPCWDDDKTRVPDRVSIHFHDGDALRFTATDPSTGTERQVMFRDCENDAADDEFVPWIKPNGSPL